MPEEKKEEKKLEEKQMQNKGSHNLQIKIPIELKEKLEHKAEQSGVALNQYIMYMFVRESKEN